jgi:hypothetical protein
LDNNSELDYDSDLELEIAKNLFQLAKESFHDAKYEAAEIFLQKRLSKFSTSNSTSRTDAANMGSTTLQLACCQLLQSRWGPGSSVLLTVARDSPMELKGLPTLLHAAAVGFLSVGSHADAQRFCKLALQRKRKVWGRSSVEYAHTLALLVRIAESRGDGAEAQALKRAMSQEYCQRDFVCDDTVTGLAFMSCSEMIKTLNDLWGQPPIVQLVSAADPATNTDNIDNTMPQGLAKVTKLDMKDQSPIKTDTISLVNASHSDPGGPNRARPLPAASEDKQLSITTSETLSSKTSVRWYPPFSSTLFLPPVAYLSTYSKVYAQLSSKICYPPLPIRESETDTYKECVSDLYLHIQSLGQTSSTPSLSPSVAVLGPHGRITCTRDWSIRSRQTKVSSGGSSYTVDMNTKHDMQSMMEYARFLEICDRDRPGEEKFGNPPRENATDSYKEAYFPLEEAVPQPSRRRVRPYIGRQLPAPNYTKIGNVLSGQIGDPSAPGPLTFEEMGIKPGETDDDCVIM